jgi:hypothetical protein
VFPVRAGRVKVEMVPFARIINARSEPYYGSIHARRILVVLAARSEREVGSLAETLHLKYVAAT